MTTHIASGFLEGCSTLRFIDLAALGNVVSIGDAFLSNCWKLSTVDLSPLKNLESIGSKFLYGCGVTTIDVSPLYAVPSLGWSFLSNCKQLRTIVFPDTFENVRRLEDWFISRCMALEAITFDAFRNVTEIGSHFLVYSYELRLLDLGPLGNNVRSIGPSFLIDRDCEVCTGIRQGMARQDLKIVGLVGREKIEGPPPSIDALTSSDMRLPQTIEQLETTTD